ncbi:hypothetical protein [Agrobacterium sp.]|uniref:hypothetical protein n=1 Tax=Agrobacterium sp. TaxID=361 RepID=UPI0028AB7056|nr:hypothetical protein [Agrobacterium sp.]
MSGLETAIRNALEKSDRANPEVRARIYQSSRQALEAGMRKQGMNDPEVIAQQRHRLETLIREIETQERDRLLDKIESHLARPPSPESPDVAPPVSAQRTAPSFTESVEPEMRAAPADEYDAAPSLDDHDRHYPRAEAPMHDAYPAAPAPQRASTAATDSGTGSLAFKPERAARPRKRRGFFARLLITSVTLAFIGMGAWWVYSSGLLLSDAERDTSVPNPPAQVESEDFQGNAPTPAFDPGRGFSDDWVEIYHADKRGQGLTAGSSASVEQIATAAGVASRITSKTPSAQGNVSIEVPVNVLQELAGKSSTIAVTLQSSTDRQTQVAISCDFSSLGDCSRHRFTATPEKADLLFRATFERSLVPNQPGHLLINSDIDGNGLPVNIYSVRILPGQ